jgi:5-dehydro-4-deoxyglucarate dehydratase
LAIHIEQVCKAVAICVIVYNRDNAADDSVAKLYERNANLVGLKDGVGDIELPSREDQVC